MLELDVLLTEAGLAGQFLTALERHFLPEKFFYWLPLSVKAWLDLCQDAAPYKNYSRSHALVSAHAAELAEQMPPGPVELVSLGAGQGDKDLLVLRALAAARRSVRYRPIDTSQTLLEMALGGAAGRGVPARGLKADLEDPQALAALGGSAREPRLYLMLGNTLGAFHPSAFLESFAPLLRPQDRLAADAEIFDAQQTMAGYDNPVNRRFAFAPLASIGIVEDSDGELVFESGAEACRNGLHWVGKHFRAARDLELGVAGQRVALRAGETIQMSRSLKYSRAELRRIFAASGGLATRREFTAADGRFVMLVAAPASR